MIVTLGEYTVDIKCKREDFNKRNNMDDLIRFLNEYSMMAWDAADKAGEDGYPTIKERYHQKAQDAYDALDRLGVYDKVK